MIQIKTIIPTTFILILLLTASCKKVINVNLNASNPQYVIEGNVTDTLGVFSVMITRSVNFSQDNLFPTVSKAIVTITDTNSKTTDSLYETSPGFYQTIGFAAHGIPGHTYSLFININGKILTATSTMPPVVTLDSLYTQESGFRGKDRSIVPVYTDPVAKGNFYHFVLVKNDTISGSVYVRNDALVNGQTIKQPLRGDGGNLGPIIPGDNITVELQCIDSMTYQFYYTLNQSRNPNSATPTNPVSNIKGGQSLGYFSAHTSRSLSIVAP